MNRRKFLFITFILLAGIAAEAAFLHFYPKITRQEVIELRSDTEDVEEEDAQPIEETAGAIQETGDINPEESIIKETQPQEDSVKADNQKEAEKENDGGAPKNTAIVSRLINWGHETPRKARTIDTIIIHSSYDALGADPFSVEGIIAEFKQYDVAAHYLIAREGTIYQLVRDRDIAYHAGASTMPDGRANVNQFSIGIEMVNTKENEFTKKQYSALNSLVAHLKKSYPIKNVLGHSDIAPGRKTDPWNIEWNKVAR